MELRRQRETFHSKLKDSAKPLILDKDGNKHFAADATVSLGSFQEIVDVCLKAAGSVCHSCSKLYSRGRGMAMLSAVRASQFVRLFVSTCLFLQVATFPQLNEALFRRVRGGGRPGRFHAEQGAVQGVEASQQGCARQTRSRRGWVESSDGALDRAVQLYRSL